MSEPKFSPGEWTLLDDVVDGGIVGTEDDVIFHLPLGDSKERRANANLLAASKDLYAACKAALARLIDLGSEQDADTIGPCAATDACRAALAKAEGK